MTQIFEHTDSNGDNFEVTRYQRTGEEELLSVTCTADDDQATVNLDKAAVRRMHEELGNWLAEQNVLVAVAPETRIDEAEEAVTNALGTVSGVIKTEHRVDRDHYTSQFGAVADRISDLIGETRGVADRIKDMHNDLFRQQSAAHTSAVAWSRDLHKMLHGLLTEIRDRLPEPAPKVCGVPGPGHDPLTACTRSAGHEGRHADELTSWPVVRVLRKVCGDTNPNGGQICVRPPDHLGYHWNVESHEDMHHAEARGWQR